MYTSVIDKSDKDQTGMGILENLLGDKNLPYRPSGPVSVIGDLSKHGYCFVPDEKAEIIYELMRTNHDITEFTVIEDSAAVGFMTRTTLNEKLGGRYGFTLNACNPIREIMEKDFLKVDYYMPIDRASKLAMRRPFEQLYNPVIVEKDGIYSGIVTVKDMLDTCRKMALAERDEIALMRDNLKIGLFFMDRNYIIQDKYSRYLETMLSETNLAGKKFSDILSASFSEKELEGVKDYFNMLFEGNLDQSTLEDINVLQEINYESVSTGVKKVFSCEFAMIERNRKEFFALVSVYDITTEAELENRLTEEENRRQEEMRAVFELIHVEPLVFDDFLYDVDNEFERINETLEDKKLSAHNALVEIYQSIHAIKSNAVILGLNTFGNKAHDLEAMIKKLREKEEVTENDMKNLAGNIANLLCEKDSFKATLDKINSFKSAGGGSENQKYYVMLELLKKTVTKVSADAGKKIKFVVDRIDNEAIDRGPGRTIKEILMQLIRNSALHGIETPEERSVCGKDETGVIWLSIKLKDEEIHVNLGDDGRGIDFDKIAKKALRLNMISKEEAKDRNVLLKAIFSPGFSTAETEGVHAGRGIGLSLVYDRVRKGKGSIKVETEAGRKTIFKITFPAGVSAK